jgi:SAM-dependent methyltransferase
VDIPANPGAGDDWHVDGVVVAALELLARGRAEDALRTLQAATGEGRLRRELAEHLTARGEGRVYDDPAAFQEFIAGGGNVALYEATIELLAGEYAAAGSVLDLGCGDARAVVAAAASLDAGAPVLDLVEPSDALLAQASENARSAGLVARTHRATAQEFLRDAAGKWDLVQSTFALHSIPPGERAGVLTALRRVASRVLIVEFDVPAFADGGPEHLAYLAQRYELGLAEYPDGPVAQGFLMPVLVGQVDRARPRLTWEQPAAAWAGQLREAGWDHAAVRPLADYWWAPAVAITGS